MTPAAAPIRLTREELAELTERKTAPAQIRVLAALGIKHDVHPITGRPIVYRHTIERRHGGQAHTRATRPDFTALEALA